MAELTLSFGSMSGLVKGQGGTTTGQSTVLTKNYTNLSTACNISYITMSFDTSFGASQYKASWSWSLQLSNDGGNTWSDIGFAGSIGGLQSNQTDWFTGSNYTNGIDGILGHSVQFRLNCSFQRDTTYWLASDHHLEISNIQITINYTPKNWVEFQDHNAIQISRSAVNVGASPTAPSYTKPTNYSYGYDFDGWTHDGNLYTSTLPQCTGADIVYKAQVEQQVYEVALQAVVLNGSLLQPQPPSLTLNGNGTYHYGDTITISYPSNTDYIVSSGEQKYIFKYYTVTHSGADVTSYTQLSSNTLVETISTEDAGMFTDGRIVTVTAYFQRVFDLTVGFDSSKSNTNYTDGLNSITVSYTDASGAAATITKTSSQLTNGLMSVRGYNNSFTVDFVLGNTVSHPDDYTIESINTSGFTDGSQKSSVGGLFNSYPVSYNIAASSSTAALTIEVLKNYFAVAITYENADTGDNPTGTVKVYRAGSADAVSDLSRIPRGNEITIDANDTNTGTKNTKYTAVLSTARTDVALSNSNHIATFTPTVITSGNISYAMTATLSAANCTITKTITTVDAGTGNETTSITTSTVRRKSSTTITQAQDGIYTIRSASLSVSGQSVPLYTWSDVTSINYPVEDVTDNLTLLVYRIPNRAAYVYSHIDTSAYGIVQMSVDSVLRAQYSTSKIAISSIVEELEYEVTGIKYKWFVTDSNNVTSAVSAAQTIDISAWVRTPHAELTRNVFAPVSAFQIPYRNTADNDDLSVLASDSVATCFLYVTYRKNILYYSSQQNNVVTVTRPSALYYTPVGESPQQIIAVYAQNENHTTPILLYGDPDNI